MANCPKVSRQTLSTHLVLSYSYVGLHKHSHTHTRVHTHKNQYAIVSSPGAGSGPRPVVSICLWSFRTEHPFIRYLSPLIPLRVTAWSCLGGWGRGVACLEQTVRSSQGDADVGLVRANWAVFFFLTLLRGAPPCWGLLSLSSPDLPGRDGQMSAVCNLAIAVGFTSARRWPVGFPGTEAFFSGVFERSPCVCAASFLASRLPVAVRGHAH